MNLKDKYMRTKIYLFIAAVFAALIFWTSIQTSRLNSVKAERDVYMNNTNALLMDVAIYKTNDSLNAATVGELQMTLSEYKKYRADDLALIKSLKTKNRDLASATSIQSQTITTLQGKVRDSVVYRDKYIRDTLKCIDISDKWFELKGCSNTNGDFFGSHISRDSLFIAETIKFKRFLGFLWETSRIENRRFDVGSKNPDTQIIGFEVITIRE